MPKSKYPDKLDTSVEIPVIRDNITEIGSDVLNSLRSAIFQVEKTLGINPQGAIGNTVAARLSNVLDDNGNILKEALDRSNVLSGPISDVDVSKVAAIDESKLRLNFPTQLLEDQIAILDSRLDNFITALEELSALLSAHIHPDATNRHYAQAIAVEEADAISTSVATMSLAAGTLQEVLEEIYNAHINYTGEGISSINNSHTASQIFYDNTYTSDIIPSNDVQDAIDDLVAIEGAGLRNTSLNFNSNGIIRTGSTFDSYEGLDIGSTLIDEASISYAGPAGFSTDFISFDSPQEETATVSQFDILTLSGSADEGDNIEYLISEVHRNTALEITGVTVFGGPKSLYELGISGKITKNIYRSYNENGLNCCARPRYLKTNIPDIQVAHPNAATAITSGIRPKEITSSTNLFSITIDGGDPIEIDAYDSDLGAAGYPQTLDSIVHQINREAVENKLNIAAYKMRSLSCYELAIAHNVPNMPDTVNRTIKIEAASSDDCTTELGFTYLLEREIEGQAGNSYHINGYLLDEFGNIISLSNQDVSLNTGTSEIQLNSDSESFLSMGVRVGDLIVISGSDTEDDNGTYRIASVHDEKVTSDHSGYTFSGELADDSSVYILKTTAPVGEMEFSDIAANGSILFDVFVTQDQEVYYSKRMLVDGQPVSSQFEASVVDASSGFLLNGETAKLIFTGGASPVTVELEDPTLAVSDPVVIGSTGMYKIHAADGMSFVVLDVWATGSGLITAATTEVELTGYDEIPSSALHLCRGSYSTSLGMVLGHRSATSGSESVGIPSFIDKRSTGTADHTIIGESFIEKYIQGPRNELRGSGIIRSIELESVTDNGDGTFAVTISPGVAVINGIRYEYYGGTDLILTHSENFYISLDSYGCIISLNETAEASPFANQNVAHIAYVDISDSSHVDLRLFVDHLDYKVIADITVANDQRFGHFTDVKKAVDYARMFSKMFPNMGTPSVFVKEGEYEIGETIIIDFDLAFRGAGPQTVIKRGGALLSGNATNDSYSPTFMIGGGEPAAEEASDDIIFGTTFENFTYLKAADIEEAGVAFSVVQDIWSGNGNSPSASFRFNGISFTGEQTSDHDGASDTPYELAIKAGPELGGFLIGNIFITNCFFNWFGYGHSPCYLNNDNEFRNVVVTGNIALNVNGDEGVQSGSNYGVIHVRDPADYVDVTGDGNVLTGIIDANNVSDDQ